MPTPFYRINGLVSAMKLRYWIMQGWGGRLRPPHQHARSQSYGQGHCGDGGQAALNGVAPPQK
jgi:hypothetical protein